MTSGLGVSVVQPIPLHPSSGGTEAPLDSPEVLVINALIQSGTFNPEKYRLRKEMLSGWSKAWQFCVDHQQKAGTAPDPEVFRRHFPDFEILSNVPIEWAADKLREAHHQRTLRTTLMDAIGAINLEDYEGATELIKDAARPTQVSKPRGLSAYDPASVDDDSLRPGYPMPYVRLQNGTGGHRKGEFWLTGARLGQGKSWYLPIYGLALAEAGANVAILSCEMPARDYMRRVHQLMAAHDSKLQAQLRHPDPKVRMKALDKLPRLPGKVTVMDPSHTRMSIRTVEDVAADHDAVLVDHVGLLTDKNGKRAVEDWRVMAAISNDLKEIALAADVGIHGAVQINREGESSSATAPKVSQLAQGDALGQDADVVITMRRMGERSMKLHLAKTRNGRNDTWYTRFEPAEADFTEITKETALDRALMDGAREDEA